jgi:ferredoxin
LNTVKRARSPSRKSIVVQSPRKIIEHGKERRGLVTLTYPNRSVRVPRGLSVLEASLRYNIPHAHVCGGRGRCSTCRIRILGRHESVPPNADRMAMMPAHFRAKKLCIPSAPIRSEM